MPIYMVHITMIVIDPELSYLGPRTFQGTTSFTEFVSGNH